METTNLVLKTAGAERPLNSTQVTTKGSGFYRRYFSERDYYAKQNAVIQAFKQPRFSAESFDQVLDQFIQFVGNKAVASDSIDKLEEQSCLLQEAYEKLAEEFQSMDPSKRTQFAHHFDERRNVYLLKNSSDQNSAALVRDLPVAIKIMGQRSALSMQPTDSFAILGRQFSPETLLKLSATELAQREEGVKARISSKIEKLLDAASQKKLTREDVTKALGADQRYIARLESLVDALQTLYGASQQLPALRQTLEKTKKNVEKTTEEFRKVDAARDRIDAASSIPSSYRAVYDAIVVDQTDIYMFSFRERASFKSPERFPDSKSEYFQANGARAPADTPPDLIEKKTKVSDGPSIDILREMHRLPSDLRKAKAVRDTANNEMKNLEALRFQEGRGKVHAELSNLLNKYPLLLAPKTIAEAQALVGTLRNKAGVLGKEIQEAEFNGRFEKKVVDVSSQKEELNLLMQLGDICSKWISAQEGFEKSLAEKTTKFQQAQSAMDQIEKRIGELDTKPCTITMQYLFDTTRLLGKKKVDWNRFDKKMENLAFGAFKKAWEKKAQKKADYQNAWTAHHRAELDYQACVGRSLVGSLTVQNHVSSSKKLAEELTGVILDREALSTDVKNTPAELKENIQKVYEATLSATWDSVEHQKPTMEAWRNELATRMFILVGKINEKDHKRLDAADRELLSQVKKYAAHLNLADKHLQDLQKEFSDEVVEAYTALLKACHSYILKRQ